MGTVNKDELDILFKKHMKLARQTLYRVFPKPKYTAKRKGLDLEDMYQYAYTGLWKACLSYDPSKGTSFRTHAINHIRWHLIEKAKREGNPIKLDANKDIDFAMLPKIGSMDKVLVHLQSGGTISEITLHDITPSDVVVEDMVVDELFMEEMFGCAVTPEELGILNLRLQEKSYKEIGEIMFNGCTSENVRAKLKKVRTKMKRHIDKEAVV